MTEERLINIKDIEILEDMYPRSTHSIMTVEEYAEAMKRGAKFPPIEVAQSSTGVGKKYILIDGRHRIDAREMNGETHVQAKVHKNLSEKDIYIMSVELNSKHGVKLTRNDKLEKIIPKLMELKVEAAKISELTNIPATDFKNVKINSVRYEPQPGPQTQETPQGIDRSERWAKIKGMKKGSFDITIRDAKGGVILKTDKTHTLDTLKQFIGRKFLMRVESGNIMLQEAD
jgi:hypothetical protein